MTLLFVVVGIAVIAGAFWFAVGRLDAELPDATSDLKPDERSGEPAFDVVLRGYRMDEVEYLCLLRIQRPHRLSVSRVGRRRW